MIRENTYWLEDLVQMSSLNYYCCFEIALSGATDAVLSLFQRKTEVKLQRNVKMLFFKNYAKKGKYTPPEESFLRLLDFDVLKKDPAWIE